MSRPLFMFRPNLQNEEHRRAWEILQAVPEGQKNAFLVQVILENAQREELETILRRVLQEELKAVPSQPIPFVEPALTERLLALVIALSGRLQYACVARKGKNEKRSDRRGNKGRNLQNPAGSA